MRWIKKKPSISNEAGTFVTIIEKTMEASFELHKNKLTVNKKTKMKKKKKNEVFKTYFASQEMNFLIT